MQPKYTWSKKNVGSPKSTSLFSTFHIGLIFCFLPPNLMSSKHTDKNNPFYGVERDIPNLEFSPSHVSIGFSQIAFPRIVLPKDDHTDSLSRGTTGSSILDHDFGHLCRGRRIQMSGHSDLGIFNNFGACSIFTRVQADTASAACPAQPGSLEMISMTFPAVICDADGRCAVNTA